MKKIKNLFAFFLALIIFTSSFTMSVEAANITKPKITSVYASRNVITVKWDKKPESTGYVLEYATNNKFKNKKTINYSKSTTKARLEGLKYSTKYYIRLRAKKNTQKSSWVVVSHKTRNKNEAASTYIKELSASQAAFTIKVKGINKSNGYKISASGYQIQYTTDKNFKNNLRYISFTSTERTVKKLASKQKYYVRVRTYRTVNKKKYFSEWSAKKSVTTWHKYTPNPVSAPRVESASGAVYVVPKFKNVSGCQVQCSAYKDFSKNVYSKYITKSTPFMFEKLGNTAKTYYVRMRAYNKRNGINYYSKWTNTVSAKTIEVASPEAPKVQIVDKTEHTITISIINEPSNATAYKVEYTDKTDFSNLKSKIFATKTYTIAGLKDNTKYFIRVSSLNQKNGNVATTVSRITNVVETPKDYRPAKTEIHSDNINAEEHTVTFSLKEISEIDGYTVQYSTNNNFTEETSVFIDTEQNNITVENLKYDTVYYFRARTNKNGYSSEWSSVISVEIPNPLRPTTPEIVSKTTTINSIKLTWSECEKAEYYTVQYGQKSNFSDAVTQKVTTTSFTAKDLFDGETYYFRVRANNSNYNSEYVSTSIQTKARVINQGVVATKATANSATTTKYGQSGWTFNKPCLYSQYAFKLWKGNNADKIFNDYYYLLKRVYKETGCNDNMDDITKFIRITEWIYCNVDYADEDRINIDITAYEAVTKGKTTCMGYAALFVDLCYLANIPAYYVASDRDTTFNHAYAGVKLNGNWYIGNTQDQLGFGDILNCGYPFDNPNLPPPYNNIFISNLEDNEGVGGFYYINDSSKYWNRMAVDYQKMIKNQCQPYGTSITNKNLDSDFLNAAQVACNMPMVARRKSKIERVQDVGYNIIYKSSYIY